MNNLHYTVLRLTFDNGEAIMYIVVLNGNNIDTYIQIGINVKKLIDERTNNNKNYGTRQVLSQRSCMFLQWQTCTHLYLLQPKRRNNKKITCINFPEDEYASSFPAKRMRPSAIPPFGCAWQLTSNTFLSIYQRYRMPLKSMLRISQQDCFLISW